MKITRRYKRQYVSAHCLTAPKFCPQHRIPLCVWSKAVAAWARCLTSQSAPWTTHIKVFLLFLFGSINQRGWEVQNDKVWQLRGAAGSETVEMNFPVKPQEKLELIYFLQVDMGLIAMVTGHVLQHPQSSCPPLPSYSHHSSKGDIGIIVQLQLCLWISLKQRPRETTHVVTDALSLSLCLIFLFIFHLSAKESLFFSPTPGKKKSKLDVDCAVTSSPELFISHFFDLSCR